MFDYFKDNYAWNMAVATLVEDVGTLAEPMEAFQAVEALSKVDPAEANNSWFAAMAKLAKKLERLADEDFNEGHALTASRKYHRAAMYFLRAERMLGDKDPRKLPAYKRAIANFRTARDLGQEGVEFIDIPYKAGFMPALLIKAPGEPNAPIVFHIQGYDSVKETQWPVLQCYRNRGLSLLIVDQPGAGGAIRLHGLHAEVQTEHYVGKIIDYIRSRPDIATDQIGLCGISMGGYYAPRAAAYEPRIKACAAWGSFMFHPMKIDERALSTPNASASLPDFIGHGMWTFGATTPMGLVEKMKGMHMEGVVEKITCPFLIVHGEGDRQVPVGEAQAAFDAATAPGKKLKIFRKTEGGYEHCQLDNRTFGSDYLSDWFSDVLRA